ncbi:MAG TPA: hypothetical protein PKA39_10535 [Ignavibacteria bacterium]|nr:hypothetical protein [Ignavibacteria bacterium]
MKKIVGILSFIMVLASCLNSQPKQLTNFVQIIDALKSGYRVNAVIHYKDCMLVSDGDTLKAPDAIGGMDILPYEYFAAGVIGKNIAFISTSETVMIYLKGFGGYLNNYVKLRAYEDNRVEITAQYLTIDKQEVKMDETFYGEINDGTNGKAIYFYSD